MSLEALKPCPNCNTYDIKDCYVYIKCNKCGMQGPNTNNGNHDDHYDFRDRELSTEYWNKLPRR